MGDWEDSTEARRTGSECDWRSLLSIRGKFASSSELMEWDAARTNADHNQPTEPFLVVSLLQGRSGLLWLPYLYMEVKWLRDVLHYQVEWAEESLEVLLLGASMSASISRNEGAFGKDTRCANNVRFLPPLERYLKSQEKW